MPTPHSQKKSFPDSYITRILSNPKTSLAVIFIAWKVLLLAVAISSPGPGYDTSTTLILSANDLTETAKETLPGRLVTRLLRWDAIYFTQIAQRGYLLEQEWAFGWGFTRFLGWIGKGINALGLGEPGSVEAVAGILAAHTSHFLSVLVLYDVSEIVFQTQYELPVSKIAFISAVLHIVTPAGMFLSAPFTESLFSLLQFSAFSVYARSIQADEQDTPVLRDILIIASGLLTGLATTVRSNGILGGLIFAYDAFVIALRIFETQDFMILPKLVATGYAGLLVALGAATPQFLAYLEYCSQVPAEEARPWCKKLVPSIYLWAQSYYWDVGFLRYWTLSNIPLFALAAPMLSLMAYSSIWGWTVFVEPAQSGTDRKSGEAALQSNNEHLKAKMHHFLRNLCAIQMILAILALSSYHVQIITRLSSGYPVWYWWLSSAIIHNSKSETAKAWWNSPTIIIRWMIIYAMIQGGLFAAFLPPA